MRCQNNDETVPEQAPLRAYRSSIEIGRIGSPTVTTTTFWFVDHGSNQSESPSHADQPPTVPAAYRGYRGLSSSPGGLDFLFVQSIPKETEENATIYFDRTSRSGLSTEIVVRSMVNVPLV